jgi:hypothetical protein
LCHLWCCAFVLQWDSDARADLDSLLQELPVVVLKQVLAGLLPRGHPAMQAAAAAAAGGGASSSGAPNKAAVISSIQVGVAASSINSTGLKAAAATQLVSPELLCFVTPQCEPEPELD